MTVEMPSSRGFEHDRDGIREQLEAFAPHLTARLQRNLDHGRYVNQLRYMTQRTHSFQALKPLWSFLADPTWESYELSKTSPVAIGTLLGLEVAVHVLGDNWDERLAGTVAQLTHELDSVKMSSPHKFIEQRGRILLASDRGRVYSAYNPLLNILEASDTLPLDTQNRGEEMRDAFGFVLYATVETLKDTGDYPEEELFPSLGLYREAKPYLATSSLWDVALENFFDGR